jgi:hypothetical protein
VNLLLVLNCLSPGRDSSILDLLDQEAHHCLTSFPVLPDYSLQILDVSGFIQSNEVTRSFYRRGARCRRNQSSGTHYTDGYDLISIVNAGKESEGDPGNHAMT